MQYRFKQSHILWGLLITSSMALTGCGNDSGSTASTAPARNAQAVTAAQCTPDSKAWWPQQSGASSPAPQGIQLVKSVNFENDSLGAYQVSDFTNDWGMAPGNSSGLSQGRLNIVADPENPNNQVLRVTFSATQGQDAAGNPTPGIGGNSAMVFDAPLRAVDAGSNSIYPTDLWLQYKVRFDSNFTWMKGGKLPGLGGGSLPSGCVQNSKFSGFSTRLMWREEGSVYNYLYYPTKVELCGDYAPANTQFEAGKWYTVTQHVVLNDIVNGVDQKNGRLTQYVDGVQVLDLPNWSFRGTNSNVSISAIKMDTFFGGSTSEWAPKTDQYAYFDDIIASTVSPLGLVNTYKARPQQCNPSSASQAWQSNQSYLAGSAVYAVDGNGQYHYYTARQSVAAGVSPLDPANSLLDMYSGMVAMPPNGPGPLILDKGQPWLESTVAPWYGNSVMPDNSWNQDPTGSAGGDSGDVPTTDGSLLWGVYSPVTNGGILPTTQGAIVSGYGNPPATQFVTNGGIRPFTIGSDQGYNNVMLFNKQPSDVTDTIRLCNTGSCDTSRIFASATSLTSDGYPKSFMWMACVRNTDTSNANSAMQIAYSAADYTNVSAAQRIVATIQKNGSSNGLQIAKIDGTTSPVLKVPASGSSYTSSYHVYHVIVNMSSPTAGSVDAYVDGVRGGTGLTSNAGLTLPYTGNVGAAVTSKPTNYLFIGAEDSSGANTLNGALAWMVWTNDATRQTPAQIQADARSPQGATGGLPTSVLQGTPCDAKLGAYK